ncbi:putative yehA, partial [Escherichia coli 09BKT078844]
MKRGLRNGVAPYIPASFAGMPGAQATARQGWRDRSGRCKPGFLRQGWKPARAETASLAPFTTARPARGTPGK